MENLLQDLRFSFRQLAARPGFTAIIVLTLALGIGASTAVFGVLDRAVLRPLPVTEPDRIVHVVIQRADPSGDPSAGSINANLSYPGYRDLEERTTVFGAVIAHVEAPLALESGGQTERIEAAGVSAGFFTALGVPLALGRDIMPEEDRPGAPQRVVVLGYTPVATTLRGRSGHPGARGDARWQALHCDRRGGGRIPGPHPRCHHRGVRAGDDHRLCR